MRYYDFISEEIMDKDYKDYARADYSFNMNNRRCLMVLLSRHALNPRKEIGKVFCEIDDIFKLEDIYKDTRLNIIVMEEK